MELVYEIEDFFSSLSSADAHSSLCKLQLRDFSALIVLQR